MVPAVAILSKLCIEIVSKLDLQVCFNILASKILRGNMFSSKLTFLKRITL